MFTCSSTSLTLSSSLSVSWSTEVVPCLGASSSGTHTRQYSRYMQNP